MDASGGRTRPLRCFAIRVLSSASWRLRDVDLHHLFVSDIRGAKSQEAGGRSKGMAIRGHVSGGDPRSGEDERQRTFRRPPATGRRHFILVLISAFRRLRSGILLGNCFVVGVRVCARKSDSSAQVLRNSRPEFRLLALLAVDVFIFPSVFSMMARMVILYSENVLDGTKSVC